MLEKPYFSFCGPAIREYYYKDVYENIHKNSNGISFEVIFVGNVPPTEKMPDNFRYIYSEECPAYCWEMAVRESRADFIIPFADDLRLSKDFVNRAFYYTEILDLDKILISFRYIPENKTKGKMESFIDEGVTFNIDDIVQLEPGKLSSPTLGIGGIYKKDLWIKLGGLDSRFFGSYADVDLTLRLYYELGMGVFLPPDCLIIEMPLHDNRLLKKSAANFINLLYSLWFKDGILLEKRRLSFEGFNIRGG